MHFSKAMKYVKVNDTEVISEHTGPINILGVWVTYEIKEQMSLNYDGILDKIKAILYSWKNRGLSIIGKINVINVSLFVYKMQVLPNIGREFIKRVDDIFVEYL